MRPSALTAKRGGTMDNTRRNLRGVGVFNYNDSIIVSTVGAGLIYAAALFGVFFDTVNAPLIMVASWIAAALWVFFVALVSE